MIVFALLSAILAAFVVFLLVRQYLAIRRSIRQDNIQDVNVYKDNFDIVINVVTVLVGMFSIYVSIFSVHVMRQQESTQKMLVNMQQMEHQPTFNVTITAFPLKDGGANAYEEFEIKNVGEQMKSPAIISCNSYIRISYSDKEHDYVGYYPLKYYFNSTVSSKALTGELIHSWGSYYSLNLERFASLYFAEPPLECPGHVILKLIHCFSIHYTDLYGIERDTFFENETLSSKESLKEIERTAEFFLGKNKSIAEVTMDDICEEIVSIIGNADARNN